MKKLISFAIPCYNEENNIELLVEKIVNLFGNEIDSNKYDYQIQFIDNHSTDCTREKIRNICEKNNKIRAIFNAKNFIMGSAFHGILQTTGDCTIYMAADLQDPVEIIPTFIKKWEEGFCIVAAVNQAKTEKIMRLFRSMYYIILKKLSSYEGNTYIKHFNAFGLYDKSFIDFLKTLNDPYPFLRTYVSEFGYKICEVPFQRKQRYSGKSKLKLYDLYALTMRSIVNSTKYLIRLFTFIGIVLGMISGVGIIVYLIYVFVFSNAFSLNTLLLLAILLFISFTDLFLGLLGEYILNINTRVMNRPLVIEEERINFFE